MGRDVDQTGRRDQTHTHLVMGIVKQTKGRKKRRDARSDCSFIRSFLAFPESSTSLHFILLESLVRTTITSQHLFVHPSKQNNNNESKLSVHLLSILHHYPLVSSLVGRPEK